jgi:hypothetical protein
MARISERVATIVSMVETSRWLATTFQLTPYLASFGMIAWAVWATAIFSEYAPFSWVAAGFIGMAAWAVIRLNCCGGL